MYQFEMGEKKQMHFEIYDKDYSAMLQRTRGRILKYPTIVKYAQTIKNYDDDNAQCLSTGFKQLDNTIGGGLTSGLYVFGANPGLGKTSLMLHILVNLALDKHYSLFFNLEMSPFQIMTKLLSNLSYRNSLSDENHKKMSINELSSKSLYNNKTNKFSDDCIKITKSYDGLIDKYINVINHSESIDCDFVECIEQALKNYKECHNITPVVVIDFLQLLKLKPACNDDNNTVIKDYDKRLEINEIVEKLKKYSTVYKTPIILISSLSRNAYTKDDTDDEEAVYNLSVFKESGQIEYTGDFLALLTKGKSKTTSFAENDQTTININVLKTRYSKYTGEKVSLSFIPEYSYFKEME